MPFEPGIVAEVQAKVDLLSYVSQYVTLKKRGREYTGLCPFHPEKTPSFSLNAEKQVWHCYGCGAGGDLLKFVERYENVDFSTALRMLAQRAGVELRESPDARRQRSEREAIFEANAVAQAYFASALRKDSSALDYVKRRGVTMETAEKFGIGFAPDSWDGFAATARKAGIDLALADRAGLVRSRPQADGYYDFFRNRLMLPVYNLTGEVIAFGGRALGDEPPKYLNTSSTPAYTKGRHVYALNLARRAAAVDNALIVVEGYLDAIVLQQAGFTNAVATLGTAFTPEQARELRRVAPNLYLCFDGDKAGQAATSRSIDMLVDEGLTVEVVALPPGKDPDEFVRDEGALRFKELLNASVPWKDFKLDLAFRRTTNKFANTSDIAREIMQLVSQERDPIVRDKYVKMISRRLDISEQALRKIQLADVPGARSTGDDVRRRSPGGLRAPSAERELVQLLLVQKNFVADAAARLPADEFEDESLARVYRTLVANVAQLDEGLHPLTLFSDDDPMSGELSQLAMSLPPLTDDEDRQRLERLIDRFDKRRMERRLWRIDEELNRLLTQGLPVPDALREEHNALAASLHGHKVLGKEG